MSDANQENNGSFRFNPEHLAREVAGNEFPARQDPAHDWRILIERPLLGDADTEHTLEVLGPPIRCGSVTCYVVEVGEDGVFQPYAA